MSFCGTASPSRRCASPGLFCFPGFASYQEVKADEPGKTLASWEIGSYLLGTCSYVTEAIAAAKSVLVGAVVQKDMGFGGVKIPWMLLTGTKDSNPINGANAKTRLVVFPDLSPGSKYQLVLDKAEHSAFGDRALPGETERRNPNHHRAILAVTTAFWDASPRNDEQARQWLGSDAVRSVLEKDD